MEIIYDRAFNSNEWFVILTLAGGVILMVLLPRCLSALESMACFLYGTYWGMFFDHTISVVPWDFYDVNDRSHYQFMDFLSYLSYGPFSYFFIYFYVRFQVNGACKHLLFLACWVLISAGVELLSLHAHVFHYEKGYQSYWSPNTYLFTQLLQLAFFNIHLRLNKKLTS